MLQQNVKHYDFVDKSNFPKYENCNPRWLPDSFWWHQRRQSYLKLLFFFFKYFVIFFLSKNYCVKGKQAVYMNDALNITGTIKEIKKNLKIDLRKKFLFLMFISFFFLPDRNVLQRRLFINDALYLIDTIFPGRIVPCWISFFCLTWMGILFSPSRRGGGQKTINRKKIVRNSFTRICTCVPASENFERNCSIVTGNVVFEATQMAVQLSLLAPSPGG